jgi:uncharacterized protein YyaL (SSP411 family)
MALLHPEDGGDAEKMIPLLEGKTLIEGAEAVYICRDFACRAPVTSVDAVEKALAEL